MINLVESITEPGALIGYGQRGPIYLIAGGDETASTGSSGLPSGGLNPVWNELMEKIPAELHQEVTPVLQNWSRSVDQGFQRQAGRYAPYKEFVEGGVDPEVLKYSINLYQAIENEPLKVLEALAEATGRSVVDLVESGMPAGTEEDGEPDYKSMLEALRMESRERDELIASYLMDERERTTVKSEETALEIELDTAHQKWSKDKGFDFDEYWVLSRVSEGYETEDAIKEFYEFAEKIAKSTRPQPPVLLGSGGSMESTKQDFSKMKTDDLNKNIVAILQGFASQK